MAERKSYLNVPLFEAEDGEFYLRRKKLLISALEHLTRIQGELGKVTEYLTVLCEDLPSSCED